MKSDFQVKLDLPYLVALNQINGLGPVTLFKLLELFNFDAEKLFKASFFDLTSKGVSQKQAEDFCSSAKNLSPEKLRAQLAKEKINLVTVFDQDYPALLKEIYAPPLILYYRGEPEILADLNKPMEKFLAVVGARKLSSYGKNALEKILPPCIESGLTIVSGLAVGADSLAHQLALEYQGRTIAILGSGLAWDYLYPQSRRQLAQKIIEQSGLIFSEFPPYTQGLPYNFPRRNRLISGLCQATLVADASFKSGALITAKYALEQNREVLAVPGPIESTNSQGTNYLIQNGAKLIASANDLLQVFGLDSLNQESLTKINLNELPLAEQIILKTLKYSLLHIDKIIELANLEVAQVNAVILRLELKGLIKHLGGQNYLSLIKY